MTELRFEAWAMIIAFVIALGYTLSPGPYWMGAFTFIAQPLFVLAMLGYVLKVINDLSKRKII
jgi:hypothetical protein